MVSYCNGNDFFEPRFESESFWNLEMTYCILHIAGNLKTHIFRSNPNCSLVHPMQSEASGPCLTDYNEANES